MTHIYSFNRFSIQAPTRIRQLVEASPPHPTITALAWITHPGSEATLGPREYTKMADNSLFLTHSYINFLQFGGSGNFDSVYDKKLFITKIMDLEFE